MRVASRFGPATLKPFLISTVRFGGTELFDANWQMAVEMESLKESLADALAEVTILKGGNLESESCDTQELLDAETKLKDDAEMKLKETKELRDHETKLKEDAEMKLKEGILDAETRLKEGMLAAEASLKEGLHDAETRLWEALLEAEHEVRRLTNPCLELHFRVWCQRPATLACGSIQNPSLTEGLHDAETRLWDALLEAEHEVRRVLLHSTKRATD